MKGNSVCPKKTGKRYRIASVMLMLAALPVLVLGLSACDGEATYTPPPPTSVGKDEAATADTPSAASVDTPTQAPVDTPTQAPVDTPAEPPTPLPPPSATPEGYPAPPAPEASTPVAYPEATSS